jgi:hypothetical protein
MARPPTACTCAQQTPVTIGGQVRIVTCARGEGHRNDHQGRVSWPPRLAPAGAAGSRTETR